MAFNINLPQKHERYNNRASFPQTGSAKILYVANDTLKLYTYGNSTYTEVDKELASSWGSVSQAPQGSATSVSKTDIGLDNVDNTSDADKPISTATQTALNLKVDKIAGKGLSTNDYTTTEQTKLAGIASGAEVNVNADWNAVSGDAQILNKPTIPSTAGLATTSYVDSQNSTKQNALGFTPENLANKSVSVVGDKASDTKYPSVKSVWDWVVSAFQPLLVSGTSIKTINGSSVLGSGDLVVGGGGGGIHVIVKPQTGNQVSTLTASTNSGFNVGAMGFRMQAFPFYPASSFTCSSLTLNVTTLIAGGIARILIYSDVNGKPSAKLFESANLDCSTIGLKTASTTFNFVAGTKYWITVQSNNASIAFTLQPQNFSTVVSSSGLATRFTSYTLLSIAIGSAPSPWTGGTLHAFEFPFVYITSA